MRIDGCLPVGGGCTHPHIHSAQASIFFRGPSSAHFGARIAPYGRECAAKAQHVEPEREIALGLVTYTLTRARATFDPRFLIEGGDVVERAAAEAGGTLVIAVHAQLAMLSARVMTDLGADLRLVAAPGHAQVPGTLRELKIIDATPGRLLRLRSALKHGWFVGTMIDRGSDPGGRSVRFETCRGPVHLARAAPAVALRVNARIVFIASGCTPDGTVSIKFAEATSRTSAEDVLTEFAEHLDAHFARLDAAKFRTAARFRLA